MWDKFTRKSVLQNSVVLGDELRKEARGDANAKWPSMIISFEISLLKKMADLSLIQSRFILHAGIDNWNRWNYLYGMPYNFLRLLF